MLCSPGAIKENLRCPHFILRWILRSKSRSDYLASYAYPAIVPPSEEQSNWFEAHIRPHESMLRAWLRNRFPREGDVDDIGQEA